MLIDLHCHNTNDIYRTPEAQAWQKGWHMDLGTVEKAAAKAGEMTEEQANRIWSGPDGRIEAMNAAGHDIQVLSLPSHYYMYWADADWAVNYARQVNDHNAEYCSNYPDRLYFWAHASLQDGVAAAKELDRAVTQLGAKGLGMGGDNFGNGMHADDERLYPVWEKACELDVPLWVHGYNQSVNWDDPTLEDYGTTAIVGMLYDETQMFWNLINGGVLDRFPTLKVIITHAGGYTPYQLGRFESTNAVLGDRKNQKPLEDYLKHFYFDPLLEKIEMRRAIVELIGADRLVYGDNFGGSDGIRFNLLDDLDLSPVDREKISSGNAKSLLKL